MIIIINKKREGASWRERLERGFIYLFSFFSSLSDLRKLDRKFSSKQKTKLIHATRTTRGHQNLGVSSNFTR